MECLRQNRRAPRRYFMSQLFLTKGAVERRVVSSPNRASWPTVTTVNRRVIRRGTEIFTTGIEFLGSVFLARYWEQSLFEFWIR